MINNILIEVCCGSVDDCIIASKHPIDRIELNHALELGGMTPSVGTLVEAKKYTTVPICCMVRPRGFGFYYSNVEFEAMLYDAKSLIEHGADGIVFGFLHENGTIDVEKTKRMVEVIHPKEAIFHKAFDATEDLEESLKLLIECGVDRVLTSGGSIYPDLEEGLKEIKQLIIKYGDKIEILPGGGVREHNVQEVLQKTGSNQIHMTAKHLVVDASTMHYRTNRTDPKDFSYIATSDENLGTILKKIEEI